MNTPKYKTIVSLLNSSTPGFDTYIETCKRMQQFIETDGKSESNGGMDESVIAEFMLLQNKLYKLATERKQRSC